jgi:hypothetical protein
VVSFVETDGLVLGKWGKSLDIISNTASFKEVSMLGKFNHHISAALVIDHAHPTHRFFSIESFKSTAVSSKREAIRVCRHSALAPGNAPMANHRRRFQEFSLLSGEHGPPECDGLDSRRSSALE